MKQAKQSMTDLTHTKLLLEKIEGGQRQHDIQIHDPKLGTFPKLPCDLTSCAVPMYGAITDPRWKFLTK